MPPISRYYDVKRDHNGDRYLEVYIAGVPLQRIPLLNKGTAFTREERRLLGLEGLLPPHVSEMSSQEDRVYRRFKVQSSPLEQHIYLRSLQDRNEVLFYAVLADHLEEMLPIIYTPTVAEAVELFSDVYRHPRGLAVTTDNISCVDEAMSNVPLDDIRLAVATDSSAILGIGDQGFGGLAIAIGKLSIYTVAGGIGPDKTLPIELDVGTDREGLLGNPLYLGVPHRRLRGQDYLDFMDRFVEAIAARYPGIVLQWEDFGKDTAFTVLERYRRRLASFNDDIQGTGATALAGVLNACCITGQALADQRIVISGAGAGGSGVAWAITEGLVRQGLTPTQARDRVFVLDSRGLLTSAREMDWFKRPYAQPAAAVATWKTASDTPNLLEVIENARATILIGLSGQPGIFDQAVVEAMCRNAERPVIFPLSNPTNASEAVPAELIRWSNGRAIIATGSPFEPVDFEGRTFEVAQGNNAFIFPGLGFGAVLAKVSEVTDGMVIAAAYALAEYTQRTPGRVYPPVAEMRAVSAHVAAAAIEQARCDGVAREKAIATLDSTELARYVQERCWSPHYLPYVRGEQFLP
jgi:malate dehydrogenase (oxaloacetate-decarboxylating)